ncbi:MAG: DNA-processing protein DprA [Solirubrobacteraceae bacterium]
MSGRLDVRRYDAEHLAHVMALPDAEMLEALGLSNTKGQHLAGGSSIEREANRAGARRSYMASACRHDHGGAGVLGKRAFATATAAPAPAGGDDDGQGASTSGGAWGAPAVLHLAGELDRLRQARASPVVAVVGTRRATDYGRAVAAGLGHDLAEAGVIVLSAFAEGIGAATLAGTLKARGGVAIGVMPGGVDVCSPAFKHGLHRELLRTGCAISEMPPGERPRRWCIAARSRMIAGLADVVAVVEAEDRPGDLMPATFARSLGRGVVAFPGRITSPASQGAHELLATGAGLVRDAADVLDALAASERRAGAANCRSGHGVSSAGGLRVDGQRSAHPRTRSASRTDGGRTLGGELRSLLAAIQAGTDTLERLAERNPVTTATLEGLAELELRGLISRGDGGRYVPCM